MEKTGTETDDFRPIPHKKKLLSLRNAMEKYGIDTYIIPLSDPHLGENVTDHWQIIKWLTGFSGSAATVVVTGSFAGLWTDSRYFIQAQKQLEGTGFKLVKPETSPPNDFLSFAIENTRPGGKIGFDGRIFSLAQFRKFNIKKDTTRISLDTKCDLISSLWNERPELPVSQAFDHPVKFSGKDRSLKISEVREQITKEGTDFHLLTSPDDIMWLLNIRGSDMKYSPLLLSYALVGKEQVILFANESGFSPKLASQLDRDGIIILPYEEFERIIPGILEGSSVLIPTRAISVAFYNLLSRKSKVVEGISIPAKLKAIKNKIEIENLGQVMIKDGIALTRFFFWFDQYHGKRALNEYQLSEKLLEFRSLHEGFLGPSFDTIAAFNENSALPHYKIEGDNGAEIGERGILLIDSGAHYMGGTTDITRTISIGVPGSGQKRDFTLVLKGNINLAMAKFPEGTRGYQLDILARKPLWESGINYGHGTGHGIGYCLNVHDGPQSISPADNRTAIEPGMLTSNEPAIYREGEYGIRIENLLLCYEDEETEFGKFLKFDTVSLCYIDKSLIDRSLLNTKEIDWLNDYHSEVYEKLSPHLSPDENQWLRDKTSPL